MKIQFRNCFCGQNFNYSFCLINSCIYFVIQNSLKRPLEEDDDESEEDEDDEEEEQEKDDYNDVEDYSDGSASPNRRLREPRSCSVRDDDKTILKMMLNYLLKNLQK